MLCFSYLFLTFAPAKSDGALAQLVEHRTENPCVPGSIPGGTTRKGGCVKIGTPSFFFQGIPAILLLPSAFFFHQLNYLAKVFLNLTMLTLIEIILRLRKIFFTDC